MPSPRTPRTEKKMAGKKAFSLLICLVFLMVNAAQEKVLISLGIHPSKALQALHIVQLRAAWLVWFSMVQDT